MGQARWGGSGRPLGYAGESRPSQQAEMGSLLLAHQYEFNFAAGFIYISNVFVQILVHTEMVIGEDVPEMWTQ